MDDGDRWVNAVVTLRVPLYGVDPDAEATDQRDAAVEWWEALVEQAPVLGDVTCSVGSEVVVDGEPEESEA